MQKGILVYTDDRTATGSLIPSLRLSFRSPEFSIKTTKAQDIRDHILQEGSPRILVLPGIMGSESRYGDDLRLAEMQEIDDFVKRGNDLITLCAGTCHVSSITSFNPPNGPRKMSLRVNPFFN